MKTQLNLRDLTRAALERLVVELVDAKDGEQEEELLEMATKEAADLSELHDETHGAPRDSSMNPEPTKTKTRK